jgi:hypothetical protein
MFHLANMVRKALAQPKLWARIANGERQEGLWECSSPVTRNIFASAVMEAFGLTWSRSHQVNPKLGRTTGPLTSRRTAMRRRAYGPSHKPRICHQHPLSIVCCSHRATSRNWPERVWVVGRLGMMKAQDV